MTKATRKLLPRLAALVAFGTCMGGWSTAPAQDDKPKTDKNAKPAQIKVREIDDKEAREFLREREGNFKAREPRTRMETIKEFLAVSNKTFVKPLAKLTRDKDPVVAATAIQALGSQNDPSSSKALFQILRNPRYEKDEKRHRAVIQALSRIGWNRAGYEFLRDFFDDTTQPIKRELLVMFAERKEVLSFSLFVDNFDEPAPGSVNAASNPPASFWRAKWKEWSALKVPVRKGIAQLTGQTFATAKQYKKWAKTKEARKLGFLYKGGS